MYDARDDDDGDDGDRFAARAAKRLRVCFEMMGISHMVKWLINLKKEKTLYWTPNQFMLTTTINMNCILVVWIYFI